jgi:hypothetical protein
MYSYIDFADDRISARRTIASRREAIRDSLAVGAFAVTGLVVSLAMAFAFPETRESAELLFLFL